MSKVKYPDDVIRGRRQAIEVAENLEIWVNEDEFILELFKDEHSVHRELQSALDEAASLILGDGPVSSVEFVQVDGVWVVDMYSLKNNLYAGRNYG